ncbi:MAG: hypothetical protein WCA78_00675 [Rhizomicrobium sp.]
MSVAVLQPMHTNYALWSNNFSKSTWITSGSASASGPNTLVLPGGYAATFQELVNSTVGQTWTFGLWLSGSGGGTIRVAIFDAGGSFPNSNTYCTVTTTPTRCVVTRTHSDAGATQISVHITGYTGGDITITAERAMIEKGPVMHNYVPTTAVTARGP